MNGTLIQNILDEVLYGTPLKIPADPEVKAALEKWLRKHPKDRNRPYIWLSLTLWCHKLLPYKASAIDIELALRELR